LGCHFARTFTSSNIKATSLSNSPRQTDRKRVPAAPDSDTSSSVTDKQPSLSERLPGMSDFKLSAYKASAARISRDTAHPKNGAARKAIPMIEAELIRRADALAPKGG
jgi:hypothetical protein